MVLTDSCWALSINEQVLTTMMSASSARRVSSAPARASRPIMTSLSTRFLGQPRLTKPTFWGAAECGLSRDLASVDSEQPMIERAFTGMQSFYFSIPWCRPLRAASDNVAEILGEFQQASQPSRGNQKRNVPRFKNAVVVLG